MLGGWLILAIVVVICLLAVAVQAEEPADEAPIGRPVVLDVGEGVQCRVPGILAPVPLPPGKMVPTVLWVRLDDRLRVIEAENARMRAEKAEQEKQFGEALARVAGLSLAVGLAGGALGAWIVSRVP